MYVYIHIYIYVYINVYIYVYSHICIYLYAQVYIGCLNTCETHVTSNNSTSNNFVFFFLQI